MNDIRHDLKEFYPLKSLFEQLFGKKDYQKMKENHSLSDWKKMSIKLLKAIQLCIDETVRIADEDFFNEVKYTIENGIELINLAENAPNLFAYLSTILAKLNFIQLGFLPNRINRQSVSLHKQNWNLSTFRSVQYVQTKKQKVNLEEFKKTTTPNSV